MQEIIQKNAYSFMIGFLTLIALLLGYPTAAVFILLVGMSVEPIE